MDESIAQQRGIRRSADKVAAQKLMPVSSTDPTTFVIVLQSSNFTSLGLIKVLLLSPRASADAIDIFCYSIVPLRKGFHFVFGRLPILLFRAEAVWTLFSHSRLYS